MPTPLIDWINWMVPPCYTLQNLSQPRPSAALFSDRRPPRLEHYSYRKARLQEALTTAAGFRPIRMMAAVRPRNRHPSCPRKKSGTSSGAQPATAFAMIPLAILISGMV